MVKDRLIDIAEGIDKNWVLQVLSTSPLDNLLLILMVLHKTKEFE